MVKQVYQFYLFGTFFLLLLKATLMKYNMYVGARTFVSRFHKMRGMCFTGEIHGLIAHCQLYTCTMYMDIYKFIM